METEVTQDNRIWMQRIRGETLTHVLAQLGLEMVPVGEDEWDDYYRETQRRKTQVFLRGISPGVQSKLEFGAESAGFDIYQFGEQDGVKYVVRFWWRLEDSEWHLAREIA